MFKSLKVRATAESLTLSAIFYFYSISLLPIMHFSIFQARDIHRAELLAQGQWIFFGPEMSGGSFLPGPFYYFLLAIPLKLGANFHGVFYLQCILLSCCMAVFWYFVRIAFGLFSAFCSAVLFFGISHEIIRQFENPSLLPLFFLLALINLYLAFSQENNKKNISWILFCFFSSLALQTHATAMFLFIAGIFLQLLSRPLKLTTLTRNTFLCGLAGFFLPLIPYLVWMTLGKISFPPGQLIPDHAGDTVLPQQQLLYWLQSLSLINIKFLAQVFYFRIFLPILIIAAWKAYGERKKHAANNAFKILAIVLLFMFIPCISAIVNPNLMRYAFGLKLSLIFFIAVLLSKQSWGLRDFAGVFVLTALLSIIRYQVEQNSKHIFQPHMNIADMYFYSQSIYKKTHWSYVEAKNKIYYLNMDNEASPEFIYNDVSNKMLSYESNRNKQSMPDGFFVGRIAHGPVTKQQLGEWLVQQKIPAIISDAIKINNINLGEIEYNGSIFVVPYTIRIREAFLSNYHNLGPGYSQESENSSQSNTNFFFTFNNCRNNEKYCNIYFNISLLHSHKDTWFAHINIAGKSISQSTPWVNPGWNEELHSVYFSWRCGGRNFETSIAESIGYHVNSGRSIVVSDLVLAPVEKTITLRCEKNLTNMGVGFKEAIATYREQQYITKKIVGSSREISLVPSQKP